VKTHVARILAKLDVRDRVQAVVIAHQSGLARH
jgi:DNA-binding NarL/FixJ family response regulator